VSDRRLGLLLVLGGSALALAVQVAAPVGVPLYDGVVVVPPYRYLSPTGDQAGDPTSFSGTVQVTEGVSPTIVAATAEEPPQAQLIAQRDAFDISADVTELAIAITPIPPPAQPATGAILGNAYEFSVKDQAGRDLNIKPCDGCVSLLLRAPENSPAGQIARFVGGEWQPIRTSHAGTVAMYQANPKATGIYAVVSTGEGPGPGGGLLGGVDLVLVLAIAGVALVFLAFVGLLYVRARPSSLPPAQLRPDDGPESRRVPSKRKGSRRPPSGRPGR
jgi:hypothetical protein